MARWATFDCYGTLIDWNLGIRRVQGAAGTRGATLTVGEVSLETRELSGTEGFNQWLKSPSL